MVFALIQSRLQGYLQLLGAYLAVFMFFYFFITLYWKNISSHVASKFKFHFNTSIYLISVVLGSVHTIPDDSSSWRHEKSSRVVWRATAWGGTNRSHLLYPLLFTHIEHHAGAVGRGYLLPSQWVPVLGPTYLLPRRTAGIGVHIDFLQGCWCSHRLSQSPSLLISGSGSWP